MLFYQKLNTFLYLQILFFILQLTSLSTNFFVKSDSIYKFHHNKNVNQINKPKINQNFLQFQNNHIQKLKKIKHKLQNQILKAEENRQETYQFLKDKLGLIKENIASRNLQNHPLKHQFLGVKTTESIIPGIQPKFFNQKIKNKNVETLPVEKTHQADEGTRLDDTVSEIQNFENLENLSKQNLENLNPSKFKSHPRQTRSIFPMEALSNDFGSYDPLNLNFSSDELKFIDQPYDPYNSENDFSNFLNPKNAETFYQNQEKIDEINQNSNQIFPFSENSLVDASQKVANEYYNLPNLFPSKFEPNLAGNLELIQPRIAAGQQEDADAEHRYGDLFFGERNHPNYDNLDFSILTEVVNDISNQVKDKIDDVTQSGSNSRSLDFSRTELPRREIAPFLLDYNFLSQPMVLYQPDNNLIPLANLRSLQQPEDSEVMRELEPSKNSVSDNQVKEQNNAPIHEISITLDDSETQDLLESWDENDILADSPILLPDLFQVDSLPEFDHVCRKGYFFY